MVKININLFYHSLFHLVPFVLYWVQSTKGVRFQPWSLVWPLYLQVPVELGFLRLLNELWDRVALWSSQAKQTDVVKLVSSILGCQSVLRYFLDLKEGFFSVFKLFFYCYLVSLIEIGLIARLLLQVLIILKFFPHIYILICSLIFFNFLNPWIISSKPLLVQMIC